MLTHKLTLLALSGILVASAVRAQSLEVERDELWSGYRARLGQLAEEANAAGDAAAAQIVANWLPSAEQQQIILFDPALFALPSLSGRIAGRFEELRHQQADALFALAQIAADEGQPSLALRLATETIRENPEHAEARRVLGYEQAEGKWMTAHEASMHRSGRVWHDTFGWIKDRDVERYESGLRPHGRQWISAERDALLRQSIQRGWVIPTEHFLLTTNHSLEGGVALARRLESLHAIWSQLLADYWTTGDELKDVFAGRRNLARRGRLHQVWYFQNRDEYNAALRREQRRIDITLGIYFDTHRRGYFFAGEDQHPATIVHEAVHQLFQESRQTARLVGRANNFWIIEGIATYFESLARHDDAIAGPYFTLGGMDSGRLPTAQARVLEEGYYVPLAELVRLGKDDLQARPDLSQIYSQLAGLTTFFMHAGDGRYRRPLVDYLTAVYVGRADEQTLAQLTGRAYEELDREYRAFLTSLR